MPVTDRLQGLNIGTAVKPACTVASTAALTLSGSQTVDGIAVGSCERVLVKDQTDLKTNGIYIADTGPWTRTKDFDGARDAIPGSFVYVDRGSAGGGKAYVFNSSSTATSIDIGSTGDDVSLSLMTLALTGVSAFSQDTLLPLTSAAAWRSSDGLSVRGATEQLGSSDIANSAVTLVKISAGTAGALVAYSSTGVLGETAVGSSGHVLTSRGAGIPPTMQAVALPKNYLNGGQLSNGTDADHDIDVTAGEFRGSDDDEDIILSAITKQIDATWSAGNNAGGLSSSLTAPANDTWYHVHAIMVGGSADVGFDTSVTAANLVADHSATAYRRLGAVRTDGSANIIAFVQDGDRFDWVTPVQDFSGAGVASAVTQGLTVPTGVSVEAILSGTQVGTTTGAKTSYLSALDQTDSAPSTTFVTVRGGASGTAVNVSFAGVRVRTNTSGQIRKRDDVTTLTLTINTNGWIDRRGRDD